MCLSISTIFSTELVSSSVEVTRFSTPRMTPSEVATCLLVREGGWGRMCSGRTYTDGSRAELDGLERVFYLEETAFGREGARVE
jgi:hypothetical protein